MAVISAEEIIQATGGEVLCGRHRLFTGLSIDSRNIGEGELFVALRGERFDGHDFVHDALRKGGGALVSVPAEGQEKDKTIIRVKDTLKALQDIARYRRSKKTVPVVSITGTNGKTTTKELLASIFAQKHRVLKTSGNFNNHIGLPLCVSNMEGDEEFMVLEMGSNVRGDIRELCEIVSPDIAVVTNVGQAHLEGFGSIAAVRDTDLEVLGYVRTVSLNMDDRFLMEGIRDFRGRVITYGIETRADYCAKDILLHEQGSRFLLTTPEKGQIEVGLRISGRFNVLNALAAASVVCELGISLEEVRTGLELFTGVPMRLEMRRFSRALVINDVYNANPSSMEAALGELVRLKKQRTIAVLGDMLELGSYAEEAHRTLVRKMSELGIDILIAVGPEMKKASSDFSGRAYHADSSVDARSLLLGIVKEDDAVLVKGSRGMRMEKVMEGQDSIAVMEGGNAL